VKGQFRGDDMLQCLVPRKFINYLNKNGTFWCTALWSTIFKLVKMPARKGPKIIFLHSPTKAAYFFFLSSLRRDVTIYAEASSRPNAQPHIP